ncbi:MAG: hypothetical protein ACPGN3_11455 [Opitutales bacterium]
MNEKLVKELRALFLELWDMPNDSRYEEIEQRLADICPDPDWPDHLDEFATDDETLDVDRVLSKIAEYRPDIFIVKESGEVIEGDE